MSKTRRRYSFIAKGCDDVETDVIADRVGHMVTFYVGVPHSVLTKPETAAIEEGDYDERLALPWRQLKDIMKVLKKKQDPFPESDDDDDEPATPWLVKATDTPFTVPLSYDQQLKVEGRALDRLAEALDDVIDTFASASGPRRVRHAYFYHFLIMMRGSLRELVQDRKG